MKTTSQTDELVVKQKWHTLIVEMHINGNHKKINDIYTCVMLAGGGEAETVVEWMGDFVKDVFMKRENLRAEMEKNCRVDHLRHSDILNITYQ